MLTAQTSWTLIVDAAAGDDASRERFARLYGPVIAAYLGARWREPGQRAWIDDVAQDVFVECFRTGGVLIHAAHRRPTSFRAFLLGVTRNLASHAERARKQRREIRFATDIDVERADGGSLDPKREFERQWARTMVAEAMRVMAAEERGPHETDDVTLLALRFQDGLPVRAIAERLGRSTEAVHRDYARARRRFRRALAALVAEHETDPAFDVDAECARLLADLG